ncbi:MAG: T9SS type A sorting domain-containing protein [Bacteroidales bacterium]|nr:T9SS type A sorting domain-containing protein [Bacteroidales bacterium]
MKNICLFLATMLSALIINAQSITLLYNEQPITGDELPIFLDKEAALNISFIHIQNNLDEDLTFRVEMNTENIPAENEIQMCFDGVCLATTKSDPVTIGAEELYELFDLVYTYETAQTAYVTVSFIENNTNEVLKSVKVVYQLESSTPMIQNDKNVKLSLIAQPNPATNTTTVSYSVPAKYRNAKIVVRNTLGSVVKENSIKTGVAGKSAINVAELANGVYFYSIVADGATLVTKKLIVKH